MKKIKAPLTGIIEPGLGLRNLYEDLIFASENLISKGRITSVEHATFYSFLNACCQLIGENKVATILGPAISSKKVFEAFIHDAHMVDCCIDNFVPYKTAVSISDFLLLNTKLMREILGEKVTQEIFEECCYELEYDDYDDNAFNKRIKFSMLTHDYLVLWSSMVVKKKDIKGVFIK